MKALSGVDAAFLHPQTPQTPMHDASLRLFALPAAFDEAADRAKRAPPGGAASSVPVRRSKPPRSPRP